MTLLKKLTIGTAMATLALAGANGAHAMDEMKMDAPMMNSTEMAAPTMMPSLVTGTVKSYYLNQAGYVSAMDIMTPDGTRMVRFMPAMAQRVIALYPPGTENVSVYVTSRMMGKMTAYDLAGVGPDMPTPSQMQMMMMPNDIDAIDVLKAQPYVTMGAKQKTYVGNLTGYIADPKSGDVLAIVIDKDTLVRVPMENRLVQASTNPAGITPLFKNASVVVKGYDEAPLYGVVTPFTKRVAATGISVNGLTLGPLGFGKIQTRRKPLLGFDLNFFGGSAPDELSSQAGEMGYMSYDMSSGTNDGMMMNGGMTPSNMMAPPTTPMQ